MNQSFDDDLVICPRCHQVPKDGEDHCPLCINWGRVRPEVAQDYNAAVASVASSASYSQSFVVEGHTYLIREIGVYFIITSEGHVMSDGCETLGQAFQYIGLTSCPLCEGTGEFAPTCSDGCPMCEGTAYVPVAEAAEFDARMSPLQYTCDLCKQPVDAVTSYRPLDEGGVMEYQACIPCQHKHNKAINDQFDD
jgi:hypothetical protein